MSALVDNQIWDAVNSHEIKIDPFDPSRVQPASYDLTLDRFYRRFKPPPGIEYYLDLKEDNTGLTDLYETYMDQPFTLYSHEFVLASSIEYLEFPDDMIGRLEGKSSLGRLGLLIHSTAGFFDPGFKGTATLELYNVTKWNMKLYPGMPVAQMSFFPTSNPADTPYDSKSDAKYRNQRGPMPSQFHKNFQQ
jgi:dCTP deaminase